MLAVCKDFGLSLKIVVIGKRKSYNGGEFGLFYQCLPNKTYQLKSENGSREKLSKIYITNMAQLTLLVKSYPCLSLGKPKSHGASRKYNFYSVIAEINRKVGWMGHCLKNESESWTGNLLRKQEMLLQ